MLGQFTGEINVGWRHDCRLLISNREGNIIIANETDMNNASIIYPINIIDSIQRKKIGDIKLERPLYLRAGIYAFTENSEYFIFQSPVSTSLTLSWRRSSSYRNQSIDLHSKSLD